MGDAAMTQVSEIVSLPVQRLPGHVAIVMDGNGRWASRRHLPRTAGHKRGVDVAREVVGMAAERGIRFLTLFAFSSENWSRPAEEVGFLMRLFEIALREQAGELEKAGVRLRVVGDRGRFDERMVRVIAEVEARTAANPGLTLTIAANYGGRWDILQAARKFAAAMSEGDMSAWSERDFASHLALSYAPDPDLFIRTGGEQRLSNFLLWQSAYAEMYFTETLWPEFSRKEFALALEAYAVRERRFGRLAAPSGGHLEQPTRAVS